MGFRLRSRCRTADKNGMKRFLPLVLGAAVAVSATAQQSGARPAAEPPKTEEQKIDQRAQQMRDNLGAGRQVTTHVRINLRLRNGNKLTGVVKDGRFVERVDGLRFVDASAKEKGAGIRIWYTGGRRNFVFVPFGEMAEYEVLERLSQKQLDEIDASIRLAEQKQAKATETPAAAPTATPTAGVDGAPGAAPGAEPAGGPGKAPAGTAGAQPGKVDGKTAEADAEAAQLAQQKVYLALLRDYPPAGGWNRARRDEIARRKVVVGATPSEKELKFVEQFETWLKACQEFGVGGSTGEAGTGGGEGQQGGTSGEGGEQAETGSRSRRRGRG